MKKMSKILARVMAAVMAIAFVFTAVPAFSFDAKAAETVQDEIPTKARIYVRVINNYAIKINLRESGYKIKNLKSSSSNLKVFNTYENSSTNTYGDSYKSQLEIGCYARQEGVYKVSFNLVKGSKKTKKTVIVYAKNDGPFKKVTFAGKNLDVYDGGMAPADSGVFKAVMNKGYRLKKIEMEVNVIKDDSYSESSKYINTNRSATVIKNGAKVNLSNVAYKYLSSYTSSYSSEYNSLTEEEDMVALTQFRVTYVDKYTKQEMYATYSMYKLVNFAK